MKENAGKPAIGSAARMLGVREPPGRHADVQVGADGRVVVGRAGISVSASIATMPTHLIPDHLRRGHRALRGARALPPLRVWRLADAAFADGPVADKLDLLIDSPTHGVIRPDGPTGLFDYQAAIAATQPLWVIDEHD